MEENQNFISNLLNVRQSNRELISHLMTLGFCPGTIIDVGVAFGTPEIYDLNDKATLVLVEPVIEFKKYINNFLKNREALVYYQAAAAYDGETVLSVTPDMTTSSLLTPMNATDDVIHRSVPCCKLDTLNNRDRWPKPYLLKIDVQGAELDVLNGAKNLLKNTEVILTEVSLFPFSPSLPDFYEIVNHMKQEGFVIYDLFNGHNRPLDNARAQIDIAFVKENGIFRTQNTWGTPEQCKAFLACKFKNKIYSDLNPGFNSSTKDESETCRYMSTTHFPERAAELLFDIPFVNSSWFSKASEIFGDLCMADYSFLENQISNRYLNEAEQKDGYSRLASYFMLEKNELDTALQLFKKDAEQKRQSWFQQLKFAECMARRGDSDLAHTTVCDIYNKYPQATNGHASTAWATLWDRGEYTELLKWMEIDRQQNRLSPGWQLNLARVYAKLNQLEMAMKQVEQAYEQDAALMDGHASIAWTTLWDSGEYTELLKWMEIDRQQNRLSPGWQLNLARVYARLNRLEMAMKQVEQAYEQDAALMDGHASIAWTTLWDSGEYSELLEWMEIDRRQNRLSTGWQLNLARVYARLNQLDVAKKLVEQAYQKDVSIKDGYTNIAYSFHFINKNYIQLLNCCLTDYLNDRSSGDGKLKTAEAYMLSGDFTSGLEIIISTKKMPAEGLVRAVNIWVNSYKWPLSPVEADDPVLATLMQRYKECPTRTKSSDANLGKALAGLASMRERILDLEVKLETAVHTQIKDLASRQNLDKNNGPAQFLNSELYYANPSDLLTLYHELVLSESDRFRSESVNPVIIDGGANIGAAIAYFKWLYPESHVIAFEPNPTLHRICRRNIELNNWSNVTLYPYALSARSGTIEFYCDEEMPMASSSSNRAKEEGRKFSTLEVECRELDTFISSNIDFLKLDIEGAECDVLSSSELDKVNSGLIEYHYGFNGNFLSTILNILEKNGFSYIINEPFDNNRKTGLSSIKKRWSRSIFFSRRKLPRQVDS